MTQCIDTPFAADARPTRPTWSRRAVGICAVTLASFVAIPAAMHYFSSDVDARSAARPLAPACAPWDEAAGEAIGRLVRTKGDAELRQAADLLFRLRRARRNCQVGWIGLACQDYTAIVREAPDLTDHRPPEPLACASAGA